MITSVIAFITFGLGLYAGVSKDKIVSWLKSEENKAGAAVQTEINKVTTKL